MKRNYTLIILLIFLSVQTLVFGQNQTELYPSFRGAHPSNSIPSLAASYCSSVTNVDIVPASWTNGVIAMTWRVYTIENSSQVEHIDWYTITGTGQTTVLHFNPSAVAPKYYGSGSGIFFNYTQYNDTASVSTGYDYTYIYKVPSLFVFGSDTTICVGQTANLTLAGSETGFNYFLYRDGTQVSSTVGTGSSLSFSVNDAGTYTVKAQNASESSCLLDMTGSAIVSLFPITAPTISGSASVCKGALGVTYNTEAAQSGYVWTVSSGGTITSGGTTNTISVDWATAGAQTLTVNYVNSNGCPATSPTSYAVTVKDLPTPTLSGNTTVCLNSTTTYSTESGKDNYSWTVSGGAIVSGDGTASISVKWNTTGSQTVTVNYADAGCAASTPTSYSVMVNPSPAPTITGSNLVCSDGSTEIYTTENLYAGYTWGVSSGGTIISGAGTNQVTIAWTVGDPKFVSVNSINSYGCSTSTSFNVTSKASPVPTITGNKDACLGASGLTYSTESGQGSYVWSISSGGVITSGQGTEAIVVTWNGLGNQTVSVNYKNSDSCTALSPKVYDVTVHELPVPTITASNEGCLNGSTTYTTESGMSDYVWVVPSGGTITGGAGTNSIIVNWTALGAQTVSVTYKSVFGCAPLVPTVLAVTVESNPVVTLTANNTSICKNDLVLFSATTGLVIYEYYINGSSVSSSANPDYSTSTLNNNDEVYVTATSSHGCSSSSNPVIQITVNNLPIAALSANPGTSIIQGTSVVLTAMGGDTYQFFVNGVMVQDYSATSTYSSSAFNDGDVISVNVKNSNGCIATTSLTMEVLDSITLLPVLVSPAEYCFGDATGVTVFVNNPQSGITYQLIRTSDGVNLGTGVVSGNVVSWSNITNATVGTEEYKVIAFYPAFPTLMIEMSNRVNVIATPTPTVYNLTPTGTVTGCNGGTGYELKLDGSEVGVTYSLYLNGSATGITVLGTGSSISFGFQHVIGTYTVSAKNTLAGCTKAMNGSFAINVTSNYTKFNVVANPSTGIFCEGSTGIDIKLSGSTSGIYYTLLRNNTVSVATLTGTGSALDFGSFDVEGVYSIVVDATGCATPMTGTVTVIKQALPALYTVTATNGGAYCAGGSGVTISLSNQEVGVAYQLLYNGNLIGSVITGTLSGAVLTFPGLHTSVGVYSVQQSIPGLTCTSTTTDNATVSIISNPNDLAIDGETTLNCKTGNATIYIDNSEADVSYKLLKNNVYTGTLNVGNGGRLSFSVSGIGIYKLIAQRTVSAVTCPFQLTDSIIVTDAILPDVKNYTWVDGLDCQNGTIITVLATQTGVTYTIYNRTTQLPLAGYSFVGDGSDMSFAPLVDSDGYYYIVAENGTCPVELTNFGDIHVAIPAAVKKMELTQPTTTCIGDGGVQIGLKNTESGITYELYLVGGNIATGTDLLEQTLLGDGATMNYPTKLTVEGVYYVLGKNTSTTPVCSVEMLNRVQVKFNSLPTVFDMTGSGFYCDGMSGATIGLSSTEVGVSYSLSSTNSSFVTQVVVGSGSAIYYNNITLEGDYTISAVASTGCTANMNGLITVAKKTAAPDSYTISVDNSTYCNTAIGGDIIISGTQKDVIYVITNILTNAVINVPMYVKNTSPVTLATVPEGIYRVEATWGGDACVTDLTPTPVTVSKAPIPTSPINITIDDVLICVGDSTFIRVSNVQSGVFYELYKDGVAQNRVINSSTASQVKWMVTGAAGTNSDYKVVAFYAGYSTCGLESSKVMNLKVKSYPISYNLSPSNASICLGESGISLSVSGSQSEVVYELYDGASTRVDNYTPAVSDIGKSFSFSKLLTAGVYTLKASYITGRCSSQINSSAVITEDDSSFVCFPFEVVSDTLYLTKDVETNSMHVSIPSLGGNDVVSSLIDINMSYKLITSWTDKNGNLAQTKGSVSFDPTNKDLFIYQKAPLFYGKDSVIYELQNLNHSNRNGSAVIYIYVGNNDITDGKTFLIPNAFSPNGDGKNDLFVIGQLEDQIASDLQVFNRWGTLVYQSGGNKYANDWDGSENKGLTVSSGKQLPVGTYFYIFNVSVNDKGSVVKKKYSGYIELRR